jgi:LPPG:FO 2-phospho-L-lactate transferase
VGVVLLAGGTGGAKLAAGLQEELGSELTVIANTADDVEMYGGYVSPDPDLVTFWLAGRIDERGWGLEGDTFDAMEMLRELGEDIWFNLGDRDLALCLWRAGRMAAGESLTSCVDAARRSLGVTARVLPMSDGVVRTRVKSGGQWWDFQEFMIRVRGAVEDVELHGIEEAGPTAEVLSSLAAADAVIVGPSNPVISIGPILSVLRGSLPRPVVAVSPLGRGQVVKGPTVDFMRWRGRAEGIEGVAQEYAGIADLLVADEPASSLRTHVCDVDMSDAAGRRRLAREVLDRVTKL